MPLVVEDGTGLAGADSFVTVIYADDYHGVIGNALWAAGTEAAREQALRRASRFLSDSFSWKGFPVNRREQNLAWPRFYVEDSEGYNVPNNAVPKEIQRATAEVALRELIEPGSMTPEYVAAERIKMAKVGPLAVEFSSEQAGAYSQRPFLTKVMDMIGPLLNSARHGSALSGEAVRT